MGKTEKELFVLSKDEAYLLSFSSNATQGTTINSIVQNPYILSGQGATTSVQLYSLAYSPAIDRLLIGGLEKGLLLSIYKPAHAQPEVQEYSLGGGLVLALAFDPNTPTTFWATTNQGLMRSEDGGKSFQTIAISGGSSVNTKCIIVDPTNVINIMVGSEDGLYRSTDPKNTWKRIRSGLGNHKTINSLTQASGAPGARRRVWVGTTGGVFVGRQSLDLE